MTTLTFIEREITCLILALQDRKKCLLAQVGEEVGDEYEDLLMVQYLIDRIEQAEAAAMAQ